MYVCAHGNVDDYCKGRDMLIVDRYCGEISEYSGINRVLVTDADISKEEYYFIKGKMLAKGVELISTRYDDNADIYGYLLWETQQGRKKTGGRNKFGFQGSKLTDHGRAVVKRIFELRDKGYPYRLICEDELVRHPDGRKMGISTIQVILKNREKYEKEGL